MKPILLIFLIFSLCSQAFAETKNVGFGPAVIDNSYPLAVSQLTVKPDSAATIGTPGAIISKTTYSWSNTYNDDRKLTVDAETHLLTQSITKSLSNTTDISATLPIHWRNGGVLDEPTDSWHRFFGLPRGGRDKIENDRFRIRGVNEDGSNFEIKNQGVGIGDLELSTKHLWFEDSSSNTRLSNLFTIQISTGSDRYSNEEVELLAEALYSKDIYPFIVYAGVGFSHSTKDNYIGAKLRRNRPGGFIAAEYLYDEGFSFGTSYLIAAHPNAPIAIIPETEQYWDFFIAHRSKELGDIELAIRENPSSGNTTTDITFFLAITLNFGEQF